MRREVESLRPPFFLAHALSGADSGRDGRFRGRIRLSWRGGTWGFGRPIMNVFLGSLGKGS
jgi:hypothetical protein